MEIARQLAAIGFVFGLLGGALWWLRGRNMISLIDARKTLPRLQIIDRVRLTPHHSIHIVRAGNRELTIAVHAGGCTLLDTNPAGETEIK